MDALLDSAASRHAAPDRPSTTEPGLRGLFTGLSREMCRPLISLQAGFDLLLTGCEGPITGEQRGQVQSLRAQCDDLIRLTRSYLDFAGLSHGPRPLDRAEFRLGALLDESDRQFAESAAARGIAWSCRLEGDDALVLTDFACFQEVVKGLVSNAMASTASGGRVEMRGSVAAETWGVEVSDDGRGIPPDMLGKVFEPLVRLAQGASSPGEGHGMGLAVCRERVERLGGEILLRSELGRGTSALVRFPRRPPA